MEKSLSEFIFMKGFTTPNNQYQIMNILFFDKPYINLMYNLKVSKMNVKTTLHFFTKSTKANSVGLFPIYVRLTIDGKRIEYSTKKFIDPSKWSSELSRMKGNSEEARSINSLLDYTRNKVNEIQFELLKDGKNVTFDEFKNKLLGTPERTRTLIPIFQDHNNKIKALVGKEFAPGTFASLKNGIDC